LSELERLIFANIFYAIEDIPITNKTSCPWGCPWLFDPNLELKGDEIEEMVENYYNEHKKEIHECEMTGK